MNISRNIQITPQRVRTRNNFLKDIHIYIYIYIYTYTATAIYIYIYTFKHQANFTILIEHKTSEREKEKSGILPQVASAPPSSKLQRHACHTHHQLASSQEWNNKQIAHFEGQDEHGQLTT